jgi:hypothetical protein
MSMRRLPGNLKTLKALLKISMWGKKYKGDFLAGTIAFSFPLMATLALGGLPSLTAISTYPSVFGLIATISPLVLSLDSISTPLLKTYRKYKVKKTYKIGILNGRIQGDTGNLPKMPLYTPEDWQSRLISNDNTIDLIPVNDVTDKYSIVLNPFGEEYPEQDKANLSSLQQITKFIQNGGIFVNSAGLAFFYGWDGNKQDITGELFETYKIDKIPGTLEPQVLLDMSSLTKTTLFRIFGIRTTFFEPSLLQSTSVDDKYFKDLNQVGDSMIVKEFRSAYRCEKSNVLLIPLLKAEHTWKKLDDTLKTIDCYPIAAVNIGRGYLVLNGLALDTLRPEDFEKEVEAIKRIIKKLGEVGTL